MANFHQLPFLCFTILHFFRAPRRWTTTRPEFECCCLTHQPSSLSTSADRASTLVCDRKYLPAYAYWHFVELDYVSYALNSYSAFHTEFLSHSWFFQFATDFRPLSGFDWNPSVVSCLLESEITWLSSCFLMRSRRYYLPHCQKTNLCSGQARFDTREGSSAVLACWCLWVYGENATYSTSGTCLREKELEQEQAASKWLKLDVLHRAYFGQKLPFHANGRMFRVNFKIEGFDEHDELQCLLEHV